MFLLQKEFQIEAREKPEAEEEAKIRSITLLIQMILLKIMILLKLLMLLNNKFQTKPEKKVNGIPLVHLMKPEKRHLTRKGCKQKKVHGKQVHRKKPEKRQLRRKGGMNNLFAQNVETLMH